MPQSPDWKRVLEAGMQFTELRRSQARAIAADLVAQGQLARDQIGAAVDELVEMSRRRSERAAQGRARPRCSASSACSASRPRPTSPRSSGGCGARRRPRSRRQEGAEDRAGQEGAREEGAGQEVAREEGGREEAPARKTAKKAAAGSAPANGRAERLRAPRLDAELVRRGLAPSRTRAVEAIDAGRVLA